MLSEPGPRFLAAVPVLPVSDQRRAAAFYVEALGFVELLDEAGRGMGILNRDAVQLHLWVADGSAPGAEEHLAGTGSCRIEVAGVDELHRRCAQMGIVHAHGSISDRPWGAREFSVLDPDGNLVTLYEWRPAAQPG